MATATMAAAEDKRAMFEGVPEWLIVTWCSEHDDGSKLNLEDAIYAGRGGAALSRCGRRAAGRERR